MQSAEIITAIGTPLDAAEQLHEEGLRRHLADQAAAGIDRILVAGSMGAMQMLRDKTYRALVKRSVAFWRGRGELLVGVGDTGFARTHDRIEFAAQYAIDGVVVLAPYLFKFSQPQLVEYFCALADRSPVPLYLYDLPGLTGVSLGLEAYLALAKHHNLRGAKISGRLDFARSLIKRFGSDFRIIVSAPDQVDVLLRGGVTSHLDGMFSIAPQWIMAIVHAADQGDWEKAAEDQGKLNALCDLLLKSSSVMGAFTAMMNARGLPGDFHGRPYAALDDAEREQLLADNIMRELLTERRLAEPSA